MAAAAWALAAATRASASASWACGSAQSRARRRSPAWTRSPSRTRCSTIRAPTREERSTVVPSISPDPPEGAERARAWVQSRRAMSPPSTTVRVISTVATLRIGGSSPGGGRRLPSPVASFVPPPIQARSRAATQAFVPSQAGAA